jgi:glycosyltransferase involved in cell wall biosynthesis
MKILYLLPLLKNTGPSNVVVSLVNGMKNTNHKIIICTFLGVADNYQDIFSNSNVTIIELSGFNLKSLVALWKLIKNEKVDVLHSHGLLPDIASAVVSLFNSTKSISTIHCNLSDNYKNEYQFPKGFTYFYLHKVALLFIKKITYVSQSIAPSKQSSVIYNGVKIRKNKTMASNTINLIYAGRLIPSKNISFLFDCLTHLNKNAVQPFSLHIYGDGELLPILIEKESPQVVFYGFVKNYLENISENSIMINPSLYEGMPMAVLEALSCGLPVALSSIPPHIEISKKVSSGIALFDNTVQSFQLAIESIINEDNKIDFNKAKMKQQFENEFSDTSMVRKYLTAYSNL